MLSREENLIPGCKAGVIVQLSNPCYYSRYNTMTVMLRGNDYGQNV